jgi:hypothetical protein
MLARCTRRYGGGMWDIITWHDGTLAIAWWFLVLLVLVVIAAAGSSAAKR